MHDYRHIYIYIYYMYIDKVYVIKHQGKTMIRRLEVYLTHLWFHLIGMVCRFPFYPRVQELLQEMVLRNLVGSLKTNPEQGENKQEYETSVQFDLSLNTSTFTSFPRFQSICQYFSRSTVQEQINCVQMIGCLT